MQEGVHVEPHPNGASASLAFSFDWESAMGGAIHSRGAEGHDPKAAAEHGMAMRQGGDWLKDLFKKHDIRATFYGTGYNLLDGNTEQRTFSSNPIYTWASKGNGWSTDYWKTHPWYGDDPYGTAQTDPAWYFGDQTRVLLQAGHEIAPHTFGHLFVRDATPQELATDMDEWLFAARAQGVMTPTTFAFPWRSSNSLTQDFYDVFWQHGIRAVTRIYAKDVKDQYTIGAVGVYSDIMVMPDFLLGAESASGGEGAGAPITGGEGMQVIGEAIARRGTTSFWQHPEQLGPAPQLAGIRSDWEAVVGEAAKERDNGRLWIATVADITAYQRDVMSVTASLDKEFFGGWKIHVNNALGKPISGVTLTMPGDAARLSSSDVDVRPVYHLEPGVTRVSDAGKPQYPARQIVLEDLKPGSATIDVEWAPGQEPPR
jgi:peptidoglycan/xylan/chitin deacetylase (PgdA/CDA1 family)